jgi:hypothetical protein
MFANERSIFEQTARERIPAANHSLFEESFASLEKSYQSALNVFKNNGGSISRFLI